MDFWIVWKLVNRPPSQRWLTWNILLRSDSSLIASCACPLRADEQDRLVCAFAHQVGDELHRLLEHPLGLLQVNNVNAVAFAEDVLFHLRIQRRTWCPKCTPASSNSFIVTVVNQFLRLRKWFVLLASREPLGVYGSTKTRLAMD